MDPPSYGRGPNGELWKLEDNADELISLAASLLSEKPLFFLINSYTTGLSPASMGYMLVSSLSPELKKKAAVETGEIGLPVKASGMPLPAGASARWHILGKAVIKQLPKMCHFDKCIDGDSQMNKIIKADRISFSYPPEESGKAPRRVIKDLSLEIAEGEFVAILGHNGSGKSTLAKLMCMLLEPDSGELEICGMRMTGDGVTEEDFYEARRNVGMVFQNPDNQIVATIVEEDVAFGPENLGMPSDEIRRRVDSALATVGMSEYARHATQRLSGGQKQRIAIAGTIAMDRKCIIFDESTAMLDPSGRREVMDTIRHLNKVKGITVVHITHYMNEAVEADRVIVMNDGGIMMSGTPAQVFSRFGELRSVGLGIPQTAELLHMMREAGYDVRTDIFGVEECADEIARVLAE